MLDVFSWILDNWIQVFGVLTGAGSVLFLALNKAKLGWSLGVINAAFFVVLMTQYGLYGDTALNVYYLVTSALGLYFWLRGGRKGEEKVPAKVTNLDLTGWLYTIIAVLVGTMILGYCLDNFTDSTIAYPDAFTTALSFAGQYLLAKKIFQNWYLWILADVIDIYLYVIKDLPLVAGMTVIYLVFCVLGLYKWIQLRREDQKTERPDFWGSPDSVHSRLAKA